MDFFRKIKFVLSKPWYSFSFVLSSLIFLVIFVAIPVLTIPGNDLAFQISTYNVDDYIFLILLAVLSGLTLAVQIYRWKNPAKKCNVAVSIGRSAGVGLSGAFASIIGTAVCFSCIAPILALFGLGFGGASFLLVHRTEISILAIIVMAIALYFTASGINTKEKVKIKPID